VPHLHFGMQLIFDESQKEGVNQIWIDVYQLVNLLEHHKSPVVREAETKEYYRKYEFIDPAVEALEGNVPQFPKPEDAEQAMQW
ncbi:MAG: M23 family peptidase, partial [Acetanaerobacterium sp.]